MALGSKITCPFCFEIFDGELLKFRCANLKCSGRATDPVYAQARGVSSSNMGHVFQQPSKNWRQKLFGNDISAICDRCNVKSTKRLCPHCHFELSHDVGQIEDFVIAIIGGRDTGKGHYIATLIHRLEQEVGAQFQMSLRMLGEETKKRFEDDYRNPLFRRKTLLQGTQSAVVNSQVKEPMIFRLTFGSGRKLRAVNLSFFDSAGEDMNSLDILSTEARYISSASGIIFLLDPLQIEAVRQRVPVGNLPTQDAMAHPNYIVQRLRELFERQYQLSATTKVKTPIAFVLSKADTLMSIIEPGSALHRTGEHFGYFNLTDARTVHTETENYVHSWLGGGLTRNIELGFSRFHYFGASSLGQTPEDSQSLETISPLRVEDPFLWLLHELKIIKGQEES